MQKHWYLEDKRYQELNARAYYVLSEMARLEMEETGLLDEASRNNKFGRMRVLQAEYNQLSEELAPYYKSSQPFSIEKPVQLELL